MSEYCETMHILHVFISIFSFFKPLSGHDISLVTFQLFGWKHRILVKKYGRLIQNNMSKNAHDSFGSL
ncbi:hypothetical protein RCL_jg9603.t1 [Rhizophagus clarus]|uniref:Uncharacterized protein n=1 Tax=Rhizophagus clarus TaxID=94130 RepID=A0A8H3QZV6_9GLOM|nr:hypothetical protein RCL_jg9603.t1 [Rhizophagus clarus]